MDHAVSTAVPESTKTEDKQPQPPPSPVASDESPTVSQPSSDEPMDEAACTAYNVWVSRRAAWIGQPSTARRRPAYIGLTWMDVSSEGKFPKPAPLEEVVALLVEDWEDSDDGSLF